MNVFSYLIRFKSFIQFSSTTKSLGDVMKVILFNMTFTCIIAIAFNLYVVELNGTLNMQLSMALIDLAFVLGLTFAHFALSERISSELLEVGDHFYNSPWYRLKISQQKLLVLPIQRAHQEIRLKALNIFECSLPVFSSVQILPHFFINMTVQSRRIMTIIWIFADNSNIWLLLYRNARNQSLKKS